MHNDSYLDKLTWDDVEEVAEEAFDLGPEQAGLAWAKLAWETLSRTEATSYKTDRDRTQIALRFLALADLYRDFCCLMWQQCCRTAHYEWAMELEVSAFRMGQFVGLNPSLDDDDDDFAFSYAVEHLTNEARGDVVHALLYCFRGEQKLFLSLLGETADHRENSHKDDVENFASALVGPELSAFEWLRQGCPLLPY